MLAKLTARKRHLLGQKRFYILVLGCQLELEAAKVNHGAVNVFFFFFSLRICLKTIYMKKISFSLSLLPSFSLSRFVSCEPAQGLLKIRARIT